MASKLVWITIIHVLLWNFIFSVTESIELNGVEDLLLNSFRDRVRYSTHICDRLKNVPPPAAHNNNYEPLFDSDNGGNFENPGLVKDLSKAVNPVKRHASLRCYNLHTQENNEPNKPDPSITNEWQMKSTPVNNAFGADLSKDLFVVQKPKKVVDLKKIDINFHKVVHQEPLHSTVPLLQQGNFIGENSKHSLFQLNLQDKTNKIKSLISAPQHKLADVIPEKILDESLHNKLGNPSLTFPSPKLIKPPINYSLLRPAEIHNNNNDDTAVLTTDNDKQSNPSKLIPISSHNIPNKNFYQKDSLIEKKPLLSVPFIQINKPKPVEISDDKHVPPMAYRPTSPQYIKIPVIKPVLVPIFVRKDVSIAPANEQPQTNIGLLSQPKITKNGIAESTSQPNLIEKEVSISLPHKKQQGLIDLLSPAPLIQTSDTEIVHKPITIEKEVSISEPNEQQKQPIIDLSPQTPQLIKTPDKDSLYQAEPGKTIVSVNAPYEQQQSIINFPSPPQVTENFNSESTSQIIPIQKEVSPSATYGQQQPLVNFSPPPQFQQIKIQKEISIPLPYQQQKIAPIKLMNPFNSELIAQTNAQKKISLYDQQKPIVLPSPPPLIKTTTLAYTN